MRNSSVSESASSGQPPMSGHKIGQGVSVASRAFPPQPAAAESGARSLRRIPMSGAPAQPSARHASEWAKIKEKEHLLEK